MNAPLASRGQSQPHLLSVREVGFRIGDVEEAVATVRHFYDVAPKIIGHPESCRFEFSSIAVGELSVDRLHNTVDLEVVNSIDSVFISLSLNRGCSIRCGRRELRPAAGELYLLPVAPEVTISSTEGLRSHSLRLPVAPVQKLVTATYGMCAEDFRFEEMTPVSPDHGRAILKTLRYIQSAVEGPDALARNPLVHAAILDTVTAAALAAFPNNAVRAAVHRRGPRQAQPSAVRRAVDFIEIHAAEPLSIADIAAAAGESTWSLRAGFRHQLGVSPLAFLRRTRLERAHDDLRAADPTRGATVTTIARRWGFTHPGRFAATYRAVYGRSPGQTLSE